MQRERCGSNGVHPPRSQAGHQERRVTDGAKGTERAANHSEQSVGTRHSFFDDLREGRAVGRLPAIGARCQLEKERGRRSADTTRRN
jgi:hypothetical protein